MTILYIRHPAKASIDSVSAGSVPLCHYALADDGGTVLQQGAAVLGSLTDLIAAARRVVLLLAASDVTLLRVTMPPLAPARLKAALPNVVEDHILGDPADCVLAAAPQDADGMRSVAVAQRAWLAMLVKVLLAQGARSIVALPAQLCLPLQAGAASGAIYADAAGTGLELTLRLSQYEGMGLCMSSQPLAALQTLRTFAADAPLTLYLPADQCALYQGLCAGVPGITILADHWAHWIAASKTAGLDLIPALGAAGTRARQWRRWRWPLRLALLAIVVNIVGVNIEYLRLKRDAAAVRNAMLQTFKAAYPKETPLEPATQMRRNLAVARLESGQVGADEFTALSAALGEAMANLRGKDAIATLEYRERSLLVKLKPDMVDGAALAQVKAALAIHKLVLSEPAPGTWRIGAGVSNVNQTGAHS